MSASRLWAEWTWRDFETHDMSRTIAVLPLAAVEQHGPHLPLGVDAMIMEGYLQRLIERLPADLDVAILPIQKVGVSPEHVAFPGTLTLSPETLLHVIRDIGESVRRAGVRKLVIVNSHGGNSATIDIAARDLRVRHTMLAVAASWARFGYPDGLFDEVERTHGIHGGDIETSLMLAFRRDLVRLGSIENFEPVSLAMSREYTWLNAGRPIGFGWMAQDLSDSGAMGNAANASVEKGDTCADYGVTAFIELLRDVEAFDIASLARGPVDP